MSLTFVSQSSLFLCLYSSNTILHYSFCSLIPLALHFIVEVVLAWIVVSLLLVLYRSLRLVVHLLLLVNGGACDNSRRVRVALMLLDEARVQQHHALVHDLQVRGHQVEVANELLVDQAVHLVRASDLNHKALVLPLQVLGCHYKVTTGRWLGNAVYTLSES